MQLGKSFSCLTGTAPTNRFQVYRGNDVVYECGDISGDIQLPDHVIAANWTGTLKISLEAGSTKSKYGYLLRVYGTFYSMYVVLKFLQLLLGDL